MIPVPFLVFLATVLRVVLTAAQRVLCAVSFDAVEPQDLEGDDRELARTLFGAVDVVPPMVRAVLAFVMGARGGKTYLSALRLLHLALTVGLTSLAPGEMAFALFVAPDLRLARQGLRYALGAAQSVPSIARLISDVGVDGFTIRRPDGRRVRFETLPATRGGSAVRGRTLVGAVLDECAFFRGDDSVVNDVEVYRAIAPRIVPDGQLIIASTPWLASGLLFDLFTANHGTPKTALAAHAPTTLLRDDAHTRAMVAREEENNPENAAREFGANFLDGGTSTFFDASACEGSVIADWPSALEPRRDLLVAAALDVGMRSDSSALAIVFYDVAFRHALAFVEEIRPTKGAPLKPSEVCERFAVSLLRYGVHQVATDSFYIESVRENLAPFGITLVEAPAGQTGKAVQYSTAKAAIHEGRFRTPRHPRMLAQLKAIVAKPLPGGSLAITSPRRAGQGHGDIASAVVLALWAAENAHTFRSSTKRFRETDIAP